MLFVFLFSVFIIFNVSKTAIELLFLNRINLVSTILFCYRFFLLPQTFLFRDRISMSPQRIKFVFQFIRQFSSLISNQTFSLLFSSGHDGRRRALPFSFFYCKVNCRQRFRLCKAFTAAQPEAVELQRNSFVRSFFLTVMRQLECREK